MNIPNRNLEMDMDRKNNDNEINNLKNEINSKANIIYQQNQNINILQNELNKIKNMYYLNNNYNNMIQSLQNTIMQKDQEIMNLKNILQNNNFINLKVYKNDIITINFISTDGSLHYAVSCDKNETFAEAEEKLYKKYPNYRETNNYFLYGGRNILRFKTIENNKIVSGEPITLCIPQ